jgi:predicted CXXCH cytochrome family protein
VRTLIRFLTRKASGAIESRDKVHEGDVLTLGRGTDQVLHLKDRRVALEHARILRRADGILLTSRAATGVMVNGAPARDVRLVPGDVVEIGANVLTVIEPPAGFDLAFTFALASGAAEEEIALPARQLRLADTALGKRRPSWLLFGLVLIACLILPASGMLSKGWQAGLRKTPFADDRLWSSGPLALVHQNVALRCETCHERPFIRVRDSACLGCHGATLKRHAEAHGVRADLEGRRCATCHAEHNEPAMLVRRDDSLCAACHADIHRTVGPAARTELGNASDFLIGHPEFRVEAKPSHLKFPHDVHLAAAGVKAPGGKRVMHCADCHQTDAAGARMLPLRMERHCQECHRLDFDPADPDRQVPHGDATVVLTTLKEYYSARYLASYPDPLAAAAPGLLVRRPGPELTAEERERAMRRAREQATVVARDLFERRACVVCHEVERVDASNEQAAGEIGWQVVKVELPAAWMPDASFNHARHGTSLTACATCHAADRSHRANDLLMPKIAVCRNCHAGASPPRDRPQLLASGCMMCHAFHREGEPLWAAATRGPAAP